MSQREDLTVEYLPVCVVVNGQVQFTVPLPLVEGERTARLTLTISPAVAAQFGRQLLEVAGAASRARGRNGE